MPKSDYKKNLTVIGERAKQILSADPLWFRDLKPSQIEKWKKGVYIIVEGATGEVLYVGRSIDLQRRIYTNHLHGNKSTARLKKYLMEDPKKPSIKGMPEAKAWMKDKCYVQYIEVEDDRERGRVEGGLLAALSARYVEREH